MKIAITGHRPNKLANDYTLTSPLIAKIKKQILLILKEHKPDTLISGMALGIDTLFARIAIEQKIPLIAAIPCGNQSQFWGDKAKDEYKSILKHRLTTAKYVSQLPFTNWCMQARNQWMVDNSDILIAVWDGTPGGTANCVKYAQKVKRTIILIDPNKL